MVMPLPVIIWLLVAGPKVPSSRFMCSLKVIGAIVTLDNDLDSVVRDITGNVIDDVMSDIAKANIMLD